MPDAGRHRRDVARLHYDASPDGAGLPVLDLPGDLVGQLDEPITRSLPWMIGRMYSSVAGAEQRLPADGYASSGLSARRHSRRTSAAGMTGQWASALRSCWRRNAHRGARSSRSLRLPRMPQRTVAAGTTCGAPSRRYARKRPVRSGSLEARLTGSSVARYSWRIRGEV